MKNYILPTIFQQICLSAGLISMVNLGAQQPSVQRPMVIENETLIELNEDIIIASKGSPFIPTENFGQHKAEKLIITSKKGCAIIVTSTGFWDLSFFNSPSKSIEFRGNARLILQQGARLHGMQSTLIFTEQSRIE